MQCHNKYLIGIFSIICTLQATSQFTSTLRGFLHKVEKFGKEQTNKLFTVKNAASQFTSSVRGILHKVERFGKEQSNTLFTVKNVVEEAIDDRLKDDFFTIYKNAAIQTRKLQNEPVTEDKVTFYLYTSDNPNEFTVINKDNLEILGNRANRIVFLIHGWTSSRKSGWLEDMKNAFLIKDNDTFVIIVDWKDPANQFYYVSSINTYDVSEHITKLLVNLYKNYGVDKDNILLVGHSLGGQIIGFVGKLFKKETFELLPRIIALDPAGPLFTQRPTDKRLNMDDAEVVEVIHTDGGTFGYQDSCGTIDFFVNGGSSQAGCKQIDLADLIGTFVKPITCDHHRARAYFTEALLNPRGFVAQRCDSWAKYKMSYCDQETVPMGDLTTSLTGNFYLETNKEKPYSRKATEDFSLSRLIQH